MIRLVFERIPPAALWKTDCRRIRVDAEKSDKWHSNLKRCNSSLVWGLALDLKRNVRTRNIHDRLELANELKISKILTRFLVCITRIMLMLLPRLELFWKMPWCEGKNYTFLWTKSLWNIQEEGQNRQEDTEVQDSGKFWLGVLGFQFLIILNSLSILLKIWDIYKLIKGETTVTKAIFHIWQITVPTGSDPQATAKINALCCGLLWMLLKHVWPYYTCWRLQKWIRHGLWS